MTTQISINILHGSASVTDADRERAEAAALKVFNNTNPAAAYDDFVRQMEEAGDASTLTGLAALWFEADCAANIALTTGWYNPNGAICEISV